MTNQLKTTSLHLVIIINCLKIEKQSEIVSNYRSMRDNHYLSKTFFGSRPFPLRSHKIILFRVEKSWQYKSQKPTNKSSQNRLNLWSTRAKPLKATNWPSKTPWEEWTWNQDIPPNEQTLDRKKNKNHQFNVTPYIHTVTEYTEKYKALDTIDD